MALSNIPHASRVCVRVLAREGDRHLKSGPAASSFDQYAPVRAWVRARGVGIDSAWCDTRLRNVTPEKGAAQDHNITQHSRRCRCSPDVTPTHDHNNALRIQSALKDATEIKVRAERRCGEMTKAIETSPGGRPQKNSSNDAKSFSKASALADMGLSVQDAHRYEQLAAMPAEHFETAVATAKATAGEVTTAFMLREAKKTALHRAILRARARMLPGGR